MFRTAGFGMLLPLVVVFGACSTGPARSDPFGGPGGGPPPPPPPPDVAVMDAPAGGCTSSAQCDDRLACTDDECVFGGRCEHTAVNSRCGAGERCFLDRGCASGTACRADADCNDMVACTRDRCGAGGACENINDDTTCTGGQVCTSRGCAAPGTCGNDNDCNNRRFCDGVERCMGGRCAAGTAMDCSDNDPCTGDVCNETMMRCDHPPVSPCGGAVMSGTYALSPAPMYMCGAGGLGPISSIMLSSTATGVTVTGFPAMLSGPPQNMGMFTASGRESRGSCTWVYTVSGSFTMPNRFTGSWNVSFDNCIASLGCFATFGVITGTRM